MYEFLREPTNAMTAPISFGSPARGMCAGWP